MKALLMLLISIFFLGCATDLPYSDQLSMRPQPQNQNDLQQECSWIRKEISRMHSVSSQAITSQFALAFQAKARNNIADLESRAAKIKCSSAFSSTTVVTQPSNTSIRECVDVCKENTSQSSQQCFNLCNK